MKLIHKRVKTFLVLVVVLLITLVAGPVLAGGWAEVTIDQLPSEIRAGESIQLSFMVLQHGKTPVHFLGESDLAVIPLITGTHTKTGESVEFTAVPVKNEVGRFQASIIFPAEGKWRWTITPNPLVGETEFKPLIVLPELRAPVVQAETAAVSTGTAEAAKLPAVLPWVGGLLLIMGLGLIGFFVSRRKQQLPVVVDAGD